MNLGANIIYSTLILTKHS